MSAAAISRDQQRVLMEVALRVRRIRDGLNPDGPGLETLRPTSAAPGALTRADDDSARPAAKTAARVTMGSASDGALMTGARPTGACRAVERGSASETQTYSGAPAAATMRSRGPDEGGPRTAWSINAESAIRFSVLGKSRHPRRMSRSSSSDRTSADGPALTAP